MGANSAIEWTWQRVDITRIDSEVYRLALEIGAVQLDATTILVPGYTFNPWIGCTKVDKLCANCYAAAQDAFRHWTPEGWGPGKPRKRTSEANWKKVRAWNELAGRLGIRQRVFCASLADWLDDDGVSIDLFADLLDLIAECTNLDWLCLSKRPETWRPRLEAVWGGVFQCATRWFARDWMDGDAPANVWVGTSVGDQGSADTRVPLMLKIPARVRFLSCEPMLGAVDLTRVSDTEGNRLNALTGVWQIDGRGAAEPRERIDWVICGGESGANARPMHPDWARALRDQCAAADVPFLWKQWGEWAPSDGQESKGDFHFFRDGTCMERVGKKSAGRLLDGVEHNGSPEVHHAAR